MSDPVGGTESPSRERNRISLRIGISLSKGWIKNQHIISMGIAVVRRHGVLTAESSGCLLGNGVWLPLAMLLLSDARGGRAGAGLHSPG